MAQLSTVKIVHGGGFAVINERDFDPTAHTLFVKKPKPKPRPKPKPKG